MKYCPYCRAQLLDEATYCSACGKKYSDAKANLDIFQNDHSHNKKGKNSKIKAVVIILLILAAICGSVLAIQHGDNKPASIQNLADSCVRVCCYDGLNELSTLGSGFCINDKNIVVTNYHVIKGVVNKIEIDTEGGQSFNVDKIMAYDEKKDVCFLHFEDKTGLHPLNKGVSQEVKKGDTVLAIGSPEGFLNTVTEGMFSGWLQEDVGDVMQISAAISSGSSGGAVFDEKGKLIGQTYASYTEAEDINLAIPIETIDEIWNSRSSSDEIPVDSFIETQINNIADDVLWITDVLDNIEKYDSEYIKIAGYVSSIYFEEYETDDFGVNKILLTLVPDPEMVINRVVYANAEEDGSYFQELNNYVDSSESVAILGTMSSSSFNQEAELIMPGDLVVFESYVKHGDATIWNFSDQDDVVINDCIYFTDHDANKNGQSRVGYNAQLYAINNIKKKDLKEVYN